MNYLNWFRNVGFVWVLFALMLAVSVPVKADTVYTYTGNPFNMLSGSLTCPPVCSISGFFTLSSPITFTDFELVTPLNYSFTDGNTIRTSATPAGLNGFAVSGDGSGNISRWVIDLGEGSDVQLETLFFLDNSSTDSSGSAAGLAFVANEPGIWTTSTITTPEPSGLALLLAGIAILANKRSKPALLNAKSSPPYSLTASPMQSRSVSRSAFTM